MIAKKHVCWSCRQVIPNYDPSKHRECTDATPGFKEYDDVCSDCKGKTEPTYNEELAYMVEFGEPRDECY